METEDARQRFAAARIARLATVGPDGAPHLVPLVFACDGDTVYSAVDHKPKRTTHLRRLSNVRHEPRCTLLVDHYDEDWSRLWWVRADGTAAVVDAPPADHLGTSLLVARYPAYREHVPSGPLLVVTVRRWSGWLASPGDGDA